MQWLCQHAVIDTPECLVLLRRHVSANASGKGRALLEYFLKDSQIEACYGDHTEEEAVQVGLKKWISDSGDAKWGKLLQAMKGAGIAVQYHDNLLTELCKVKGVSC